MKKKTSLSLDAELLENADRAAAILDRSRSYVLEKIITVALAGADDADAFADRIKNLAEELKGKASRHKKPIKK
jgi:hypothetical protein